MPILDDANYGYEADVAELEAIEADMNLQVRKKIRELIDETDKKWARERRNEYLQSKMVVSLLESFKFMAIVEMNVDAGNTTGVIWFTEQLKKSIHDLIKLQNNIYYTRPGMDNKNIITQDMIDNAKQFPYGDLIELKRSMAVCPFHADTNPSFYVKNNNGRCFGCGWYGDTIAFLMAKENLTFPQAVRNLQ